MKVKEMVKLALRSRSWKAARVLASEERGLVHLRLKHKRLSLYLRTGTSDSVLVKEHLIKRDHRCPYFLPTLEPPDVIVDIGANIGVSALFFQRLYPEAQIYCFEPFPDNVRLLKRNTEHLENIFVIDKALWNQDGTATYYFSDNDDNYGGGTLVEMGHNPNRSLPIETVTFDKAAQEYGIGPPGLIKIDTEGSEFQILTSLPEGIIENVGYIVGELHGMKDFEVLAYLSKWFDIGLNKSLNNRLFNFQAVNKRYR